MLNYIARVIALNLYWYRRTIASVLLIGALVVAIAVRTWTDRVPPTSPTATARITCEDGTASRTCSTIHAGCCSGHGGVRR